jgi:hypothetical protein
MAGRATGGTTNHPVSKFDPRFCFFQDPLNLLHLRFRWEILFFQEAVLMAVISMLHENLYQVVYSSYFLVNGGA